MFSRSKIFILLCFSFILGIFLGPYFSFDWLVFLVLIFILISLLLLFWSERKTRLIVLTIIVLVGGIIRFNLAQPKFGQQDVSFYNGQDVEIKGIVSDEPDVRSNKTNLVIAVEELKRPGQNWQRAKGQVLLSTKRYPEYRYGDQLEVSGHLENPPEFADFSYREYLSRYNIYSLMRNPEIELLSSGKGNFIRQILFTLKKKFAEKIDQTLPEPAASLLGGILYGAKRSIPSQIMEAFNTTGLTHIVVISGYNITIIASLFLLLFGFLPRRMALVFSFGAILLFTFLVGASPSVVRAAIMGSIALLAFPVKRKTNVLATLVFAAVVMLLINPKILRLDIGYQLSFLSTAGLIFLAPRLEKVFKIFPQALAEPFSLTLAAQIFATPIILYNFGRLSIIAPLANVLVLPFIPYVMLLGFLGTVFGFISITLGQIINWSSWALLTYIIKITEFLAHFFWSALEFKIPVIVLVIYYSFLALILGWRSKKSVKIKIQKLVGQD